MATQANVKTERLLISEHLRHPPFADRLNYIDLHNMAADIIDALYAACVGALEHMEWSTPQGCEAYNALDAAKRKALGE